MNEEEILKSKKGKLNQIPLRHKLSSRKGKIHHLLALSSRAYGLGRKNPFWFAVSLYLDRALLVHVREGRREERGKKKREAWLKSSRK